MPGTFIAIDLKSFYASVECRERGLDPLTTHLVVADASRTDKTIVLAVSPALKEHGLPGRPRLFEVVQKVAEVNAIRKRAARGHITGKAYDKADLKDTGNELAYIVAPPQMGRYMEISAAIYKVYLRFIAPEDIHVYSIDEVLIDATRYLPTLGITAHELARRMISAVLEETGITATAGIGTNLYLAKVAMDIVAKHIPADKDGVRIAELDEMSYRRQLWEHRPLKDFWRVGKGYIKTLEEHGLHTMGDIALRSIQNEESLFRMFGKNAELLIDHAWGYEPCTMAAIKSYKPEGRSLGSGQVLSEPTPYETAELLVREMAELLALDLVAKKMVSDQIVLTVGYDIENLTSPGIGYTGPTTTDAYGRRVPKHAHGTENLSIMTSSSKLLREAASRLFARIADTKLLVRRLTISATHLTSEDEAAKQITEPRQLDLFTDYEAEKAERAETDAAREKERKAQRAMLDIKERFGKNAILKGMNFVEGGKTIERNGQIGGHKA